MKYLHLIRHAKSSWANSFLSDFERPLNDRGIKSCQIMADHILEAGCAFRNVFSSTAQRAQLTIEGLHNALPDTNFSWELDHQLYTFDYFDLIDWLRNRHKGFKELVIVGHNPALTRLCNKLGDQVIANLPTCAYAQIELPIDKWSEIGSKPGRTITVLSPKMFR